ncbi:MAG: LytTR family DNA-binding domain-containing protein [Ignavibacteriaceae bacterium]|nr:LytTR family DNA-binding domain-containing protein [Ignavibacteriaceae bacterium]
MNNKIKAIIIDDEHLSRDKIRIFAESNKQIEIIGEGKNVQEAITLINKLNPDLLFLDINMPGKSGVELISELGVKAPFVIFTTAYSDYAAEAFNLNAVHYLLKPFDQQKFNEAVERASERIFAKRSGNIFNRIKEVINSESEEIKYTDRIPVKVQDKIVLVPLNEIYFIEADKNYAVINLKDKQYRMRTTLNDLDESLNPDLFIRVHKSFIINKSYVHELEPTFNQEFIIKLTSNKKIPTGKAYKENVQRLLK